MSIFPYSHPLIPIPWTLKSQLIFPFISTPSPFLPNLSSPCIFIFSSKSHPLTQAFSDISHQNGSHHHPLCSRYACSDNLASRQEGSINCLSLQPSRFSPRDSSLQCCQSSRCCTIRASYQEWLALLLLFRRSWPPSSNSNSQRVPPGTNINRGVCDEARSKMMAARINHMIYFDPSHGHCIFILISPRPIDLRCYAKPHWQHL